MMIICSEGVKLYKNCLPGVVKRCKGEGLFLQRG